MMKRAACFLFLVLTLYCCDKDMNKPDGEIGFGYIELSENLTENSLEMSLFDPFLNQREKITNIHGTGQLYAEEVTYLNKPGKIVAKTESGLFLLGIESKGIENFNSNLQLVEYSPQDECLYGLMVDAKNKISFAKVMLGSGTVETIKVLNGVNGYNPGSSTFDFDMNRYCFLSDSVIIINPGTGEIINKFNGIQEIEYDSYTGKLIGISYNPNPNLSFADIETGEIELKGFIDLNGVAVGSRTFNQTSRHFIATTFYDSIIHITDSTGKVETFMETFPQVVFVDVDSVAITKRIKGISAIEAIN